ncbi:MAG: PAS domain-containing protein [Proteobacteria bacterium]|nr:PAS domain-containing protein [Pseudomonadota bacterium]
MTVVELRPVRAAPPRSLFDRVTAPSEDIQDELERTRARILSAILLMSIPIGVVGVVAFVLTRETAPALQVPFMAATVSVLAIAWWMSRTPHWRVAAGLTVVTVMANSLLAAWWAPDAVGVQADIFYTILPVLLTAVICPMWTTYLVAGLNLVVIAVVGGLHPEFMVTAQIDAVLIVGTCSVIFAILSGLAERYMGQYATSAAELAVSEERFDLAARAANDGLWDWDMNTGRAWFSARWGQILGIQITQADEALSSWLDRVHPEDSAKLRSDLSAHVAALTAEFDNTHRIRHEDGTYRWVHARGLAVRDDAGRVNRMASSATDVTEQKQFEEQLLHDAFHDVLSGLPNRALFLNRLAHSIARAHRRSSHMFAVLFLDLDRFKIINDSMAPPRGMRPPRRHRRPPRRGRGSRSCSTTSRTRETPSSSPTASCCR